jgi:hypothetical protein
MSSSSVQERLVAYGSEAQRFYVFLSLSAFHADEKKPRKSLRDKEVSQQILTRLDSWFGRLDFRFCSLFSHD